VPRLTRGFQSQIKLLRHFQDHGHEFGAATAEDYEAKADIFLGSPLNPGIQECTRSDGDTLRYSRTTKEFGVLTDTNHIRTYYLLTKPTVTLRDAYFQDQCNQ